MTPINRYDMMTSVLATGLISAIRLAAADKLDDHGKISAVDLNAILDALEAERTKALAQIRDEEQEPPLL